MFLWAYQDNTLVTSCSDNWPERLTKMYVLTWAYQDSTLVISRAIAIVERLPDACVCSSVSCSGQVFLAVFHVEVAGTRIGHLIPSLHSVFQHASRASVSMYLP